MLQAAVEAEVDAYVQEHRNSVSENGRRLVVRNGRLPERPVQTGLGPVCVEQPRVNDRRSGHKFSSRILPPYLRRVPSVDALIPALYLHGISTGDFAEALEAILGPSAAGLSPANIVRLKAGWEQEFQQLTPFPRVRTEYFHRFGFSASADITGWQHTLTHPCAIARQSMSGSLWIAPSSMKMASRRSPQFITW